MKKKRYWQTIRVAEPCTEDWDLMTGNEQVRFCSHCAKSVNNISEMTRGQARRLVRRSGGNLCLRYAQHPETKAPIFAKQYTQITRLRASLMAAGVIGASLSLASITFAQGGSASRRLVTAERKQASDALPSPVGVATIKGKLNASSGVDVTGALVWLYDQSGAKVGMEQTNEAGEFKFDIEPGTYTIKAESRDWSTISVRSNVEAKEGENSVELSLEPEVRTFTTGLVITLPRPNPGVLQVAPQTASSVDEARERLAQGEDVNQKDEDGSTAIFSAVEDGDLELVKFLIDNGAKVDVRNDDKETPLMMIEEETPVEIVKLLLQQGAKVNRVDADGDTALIRAADSRAKPEILKALIDAGADLNIQNEEGMTALMTAADENDLENVRVLLEAGADVNLRDAEGDNAWDYATEKEVEDLLVTYGVVLDPEDLMDDEQPEEPEGTYFDPIDKELDVEIRTDDEA